MELAGTLLLAAAAGVLLIQAGWLALGGTLLPPWPLGCIWRVVAPPLLPSGPGAARKGVAMCVGVVYAVAEKRGGCFCFSKDDHKFWGVASSKHTHNKKNTFVFSLI